jgi:hypothetical protein
MKLAIAVPLLGTGRVQLPAEKGGADRKQLDAAP